MMRSRSKSVSIKADYMHKQEIEAELYLFQKKCKVRTITAQDVLKSVDKLNELYKGKVPKKMMKGMRYIIDVYAQKFPNKYLNKGRPYSTHFELTFNGKYWMLTDIIRDDCNKNVVRFCYIPHCVEKRIRDNAYEHYKNGGWR